MFPTNTTSYSNYITINNVTVDDEGVYTCTVSNEGGNSSYDIFITVIGKSTFACIYVATVYIFVPYAYRQE